MPRCEDPARAVSAAGVFLDDAGLPAAPADGLDVGCQQLGLINGHPAPTARTTCCPQTRQSGRNH
jgi:hypothetical protein